jgi:hypothetical protein
MCYSEEASINAFVIGIACVMIMILRGGKYDTWHSLFVSSYVFVQLGEALVWNGIKNNNELKKAVGAKIILISVLLQPVTQLFGAWLHTKNKAYLLASIAGLSAFAQVDFSMRVSVGPNHHLSWPVPFANQSYANVYYVYYILGLLGPILTIDEAVIRNSLVTYGSGTLLYSFHNYNKSGEFTSQWCYLATGYSLLYLITSEFGVEK